MIQNYLTSELILLPESIAFGDRNSYTYQWFADDVLIGTLYESACRFSSYGIHTIKLIATNVDTGLSSTTITQVNILMAQLPNNPPSNAAPSGLHYPTPIIGAIGNSFTSGPVVTGTVTTYSASNLPPGLSINSTTGIINGTYTAVSSATATITATNSYGSTSANIVFNVGNSVVPIVGITVSQSFTVNAGATHSVVATVTGTTNNEVTWTATGGVIIGSGDSVTYDAGTNPGLYTITATSVADNTKSASCTATIVAVNAVNSVTLSNTTLNLSNGATPSITATVNITGTANTGVNWTCSGGTITGTGNTVTYTAGSTSGTYFITATSIADPTKSATCAVTITVNAVNSVEINPITSSLAIGASVNLNASVNYSGVENPGVTWTATGGTLSNQASNSATYTAGSTPGTTYSVVATSIADPTKYASCLISINGVASAVTGVVLSPSSLILGPSGTASITATVNYVGTESTAVTWTTTGGGTISGTGNTIMFTASSALGNYTITATSVADPTKSATCAVSIVNNSITSVTLNDTSVNLSQGQSIGIVATVNYVGSINTAVTWSATGGTITGSGSSVSYTAPNAVGTYTLTATSVADTTKHASCTFNVSVIAISITQSGTVTVAPSSTIAISATVTGSTNTSVTWSATGGSFTGSGSSTIYNVPSTVGTYTVTATSIADTSKTASFIVSVVNNVEITFPSTATAVGSGGTIQFEASQTSAWAVDGIPGGNSTVGTITSGGLYTCPTITTPTYHQITATSSTGSTSMYIACVISNTRTTLTASGDTTGNTDTLAIKNALSSIGNGILELTTGGTGAGTFWVNAAYGGGHNAIMPSAYGTILMDSGVTLNLTQQTFPGNDNTGDAQDYSVIAIEAGFVTVVGGIINGDRIARNLPTYENGVGTDFETGNGIVVCNNNSDPVLIVGVTSNNNCSDGFNTTWGSTAGNNITLIACVANNNRRQGWSAVGGNNLTAIDCTFSNTNGQDPGCGIDLEPAGSSETMTTILIKNCNIFGNQGGGINGGSEHAVVSYVTIEGCDIYNNGNSNYEVVGAIYFNDAADHITILNNNVHDNYTGNGNGNVCAAIHVDSCTNVTVTGNTVTNNTGWGMYLNSSPGSTYSGNTVTGNSLGQINVDSTFTSVSTITVSLTNSTSLISALNNTINISGSILFTGTVANTTNTALLWYVDGILNGNSTVGTINTGVAMGGVNNYGNIVLYKAPATTGTHTITATSVADSSKSASTTISVTANGYVVTGTYSVTLPAPTGVMATDTANINSAIVAASNAGGGLVIFRNGNYVIGGITSTESSIQMQSNVTLQLVNGTTLTVATQADAGIFMITGVSNLNIIGAGPGLSIINGSKASGAAGNCSLIMMWDGSNVVIGNLTLENGDGDGFTTEGVASGGPNCTNILMYNVTCTGNGRNGISPCGQNGMVIRDSTFTLNNQNNPEQGADFEPDGATQMPTNCKLFNCNLSNNNGGGISAGYDGGPAKVNGMTFAYNIVNANSGIGIEVENGDTEIIINNTITGTAAQAGVYPGYGILVTGSYGTTNVIVMGNSVTGSGSTDIYLPSANSGNCDYNTTNKAISAGAGIVVGTHNVLV